MKQGYNSIWNAIEPTPHDAANMRAKSILLIALQDWIANRQGTQKEAAVAGLSPTIHVKAPC